MEKEKLVSLILRIAIAFSFIYVAIAAFINPTNWIGYIPDFVTLGLMTKEVFLMIHAVFDLLIGAWLLSGKGTFYAAILSGIALAGIVLFNLGEMLVLYRDISILLAAIALAVLSHEKKSA